LLVIFFKEPKILYFWKRVIYELMYIQLSRMHYLAALIPNN